MIDMKKWIDYKFQSSSTITTEFRKFATDFRRYIKQAVNPEFSIVWFLRGHFESSVCVQNNTTKKLAYISISDVRFFPNGWYNHVLYRTMKYEKDYTGGNNNYCKLRDIKKCLQNITI